MLSNLKTNNYLLNTLAIQFAKDNGFDDAIILNSRAIFVKPVQATSLWCRKVCSLRLPCHRAAWRVQAQGTADILPSLGFRVEETIITKEMIFEVEEIFLTNAIRPIRPVICIDNTYYSRELTGMLVRLLKDAKK